jgi:flavin-dependent dehydrogenase
VILATGAAYHLHQDLDLGLPSQFVQTAQVEVDFADGRDVEVYFGREVAPGSFAWIVPFRRGGASKARIGLLASRDAGGYLDRFLRSPKVASRVLPGRPWHYRRRPIPLRPIQRTYAERVLVVGDAAGIVKPTTGGGIYYGLLTAELAAATAEEALAAGDYSPGFLRRYQAAWQSAIAALAQFDRSRLSVAFPGRECKTCGRGSLTPLRRFPEHGSIRGKRNGDARKRVGRGGAGELTTCCLLTLELSCTCWINAVTWLFMRS